MVNETLVREREHGPYSMRKNQLINLPRWLLETLTKFSFTTRKWGESEDLMNKFRESMKKGELHDLQYRGDLLTWSNHHTSKTFTKERLDRALVNTCWS